MSSGLTRSVLVICAALSVCVCLEDGVLLQGGNCKVSQFFQAYYPTSLANTDLIDYKYSAGVNYGGKLFITGGSFYETAHFPNNQLQIYDIYSGGVREGAGMQDNRAQHTAVVKDNRVLACGGRTVRGALLDSCEYYDPYADTWTYLNFTMPAGLYSHGAAIIDSDMYLFGGEGATGLSTATYVFKGSLIYNQGYWAEVWPMNNHRVSFAYSLYVDNHILACGGVDNTEPLSSCEIFNPSSESWSNYTPMSEARYEHAMAYYSGTIYIFGGYTQPDYQNMTDTVEFYQDYQNTSFITSNPMAQACTGMLAITIN